MKGTVRFGLRRFGINRFENGSSFISVSGFRFWFSVSSRFPGYLAGIQYPASGPSKLAVRLENFFKTGGFGAIGGWFWGCLKNCGFGGSRVLFLMPKKLWFRWFEGPFFGCLNNCGFGGSRVLFLDA